jgi:hypothetical protein
MISTPNLVGGLGLLTVIVMLFYALKMRRDEHRGENLFRLSHNDTDYYLACAVKALAPSEPDFHYVGPPGDAMLIAAADALAKKYLVAQTFVIPRDIYIRMCNESGDGWGNKFGADPSKTHHFLSSSAIKDGDCIYAIPHPQYFGQPGSVAMVKVSLTPNVNEAPR